MWLSSALCFRFRLQMKYWCLQRGGEMFPLFSCWMDCGSKGDPQACSLLGLLDWYYTVNIHLRCPPSLSLCLCSPAMEPLSHSLSLTDTYGPREWNTELAGRISSASSQFEHIFLFFFTSSVSVGICPNFSLVSLEASSAFVKVPVLSLFLWWRDGRQTMHWRPTIPFKH